MEMVIQTKHIPVVKEVDVVVAGGGPAGVAAAIASARQGARTLLLERHGFLGGMGTAALVNPFMSYFSGRKQLVQGIFQEMVDRLKARSAYGGSGHAWSFDPEELKFTLNEMCLESGVQLQFHTFVVDSIVENETVTGIITESKSGRQMIRSKVYIDCTGDGDLAARSGAEFKIGRESDGKCQPASIMFRMGNVNTDKKAREYAVANEPRLPQGRVLFFKMPRDGEVVVNMTRVVDLDATNVDELSRAEIEGRAQVKEIVDYLKQNVEGFENSYLIETGPQIGIRESRRIMGEYLLTADDVLNCSKFDDVIARCSYMIDIHNPTGQGTEKARLPKGDWYEIPYRCLLPKGFTNLMAAGRCISSTHEAHSSLRIQATCYAMGQAAGTAAAIAVKTDTLPKDIQVKSLQKILIEANAL